MTRLVLESLTPATAYAYQLRSIGPDGASDWSRQFTFTTVQDAIAPNTPGSVVGSMNGTSFSLTWAAVTTSSDGSAASDLDTYIVKVQSSGSGTVGSFKTKGLRFDFTFEMNRALFGTPQANVQMSVAAVDVVGNTSPYSTVSNQTNAAPSAVTGLAASPAADSIRVYWTGISDADLDHYEVHVGTSSGFTITTGTLAWQGLATSTVYSTSAYATTFYIKVIAVDVFGTASTAVQVGPYSPSTPFTIDTTAPAVPTGLAATLATTVDQKTTATVSWTAVANPTNDLEGYMIRYKASADTDYSYMTVDSATTSVKILVNKPYVNYDFAVRAFDFYANYSAWSSTVTATGATNTAPATPTGMILSPGVQSIVVQWTENSELDVINGAGAYEVQVDTANTFSTGNLKTVRNSGTIVSFTGLTSNTLYYVRMRAVDSLGAVSGYNTTASTTTGVVTNSDIIAGTITGDRITAATLSGDRVIANTLDANTLKANSVVAQNLGVNSTLTMGDASNNGIIQSFGFVNNTTGWQISKTGFQVNQGSIAAAALLIQDSDNVAPAQYADFEFAPSFYTTGLTTANITTSQILSTTPKFNSQFYHSSWTTAGSNPTVYLGVSATDYNTNVDASTTYILSVWARNPSAVTTVLRGNVKFSTAATATAFTVTPTVSSSTWVRYSGTITVPAGVTTLLVYFDSTTLTTGAGFDIDGVQLEKQVANLATASPWKPPGVTRVDGGIIRTGTILSSATVTVNSVAQPSWSINLTGAAQFGDVSVRGKILVGAAGDPDAAGSFISSGNFVTGTTGWKIDSSGAAEFQSGTFRGTINATAGTFSGSITSSATITGGTLSGAAINGGTLDVPAAATLGVTQPGNLHVDSSGLYLNLAATTNRTLDPGFTSFTSWNANVKGNGTVSTFYNKGANVTFAAYPNYVTTDIYSPIGVNSWGIQDTTSGSGYVDFPLGTASAMGLAANTQYTMSIWVSGSSSDATGVTGFAETSKTYANVTNFGIVEKTTGAVITQRSSGISGYIVTRQPTRADEKIGVYPLPVTGVQQVVKGGWGYRWYVTFTMSAALAGTSTMFIRLPTSCTSSGTAAGSPQSVDYTGLQIETGSYPSKYVDGDMSEGTWTGTAHNSNSTRVAGTPTITLPVVAEPQFNGFIQNRRIFTQSIKVGSGHYHGANHYQIRKSLGQTLTTSTFTDVVFQSSAAAGIGVALDDGTLWDGVSQFVAPVSGMYLYSTVITWVTNSTGSRIIRHMSGAIGAQTTIANQMINTVPQASGQCSLQTLLWIKAGDAVKTQAWQNSGSNLDIALDATTQPSYSTFTYLGGI